MLTQAILIGLIAAFGKFDYQLGTLYAFRPIVLCPLVGLVLGDLQSGLAIGASLELLFMGSISIGAYVPPDETIGGVLACAFAIQLGQSTEAAIALAMPIATLCLAIKNILNAALPILVDRADVFSARGNLKGVYAMHFLIGSTGIIMAFLLCSLSFYLGADAIQGVLDFIPDFVLAGFGVAANILPAMGFAMLGRLVLTKQLVPFYFLGFLLCSYANVPVLGVALIAIIIGILEARRFRKQDSASEGKMTVPIPWFMGGFILASAVGSYLPFVNDFVPSLVQLAYLLLGMAMAALGLNVNFGVILEKGVRPMLGAILCSFVIMGLAISIVHMFF